MRRPASFVVTLIVAAALALPSAAGAQARSRSGGSDGGGGGSDSGGGATTRSSPSGGDSGGSAAPRVAMPRNPGTSAPAPRSSPGSSDSGSSSSRGPASVRRARPSSVPAVAGSPRVRATGGTSSETGGGVSSGLTRTRGDRAIEGYAQPRRDGLGGDVRFPRFVNYYPWYSPAFGFSYVAYDPWFYGSGWGWSRYGWYDPYWQPFGYGIFDPWGYGYGHHYWGTPYVVVNRDEDDDAYQDYGSLRIRANPKTARVYVDGALAGTVDDFDGLTNHLPLPQGVHQIEIRADGYQTYTTEVTIEAGKTRTERASLGRTE